MARYIDADALLGNLKRQYGEELGWWCTVNMSDVGMMIEDAPTANVEPIADTVKKMQERLKMQWWSDATPHDMDILHSVIDRVAKEILEGNNEVQE